MDRWEVGPSGRTASQSLSPGPCMWGQLEDWLLWVAPPTLHVWHFGETKSQSLRQA